MSQCVPSWDLEDSSNSGRIAFHGDHNKNSSDPDGAMLDYEVAELTWENGQLSMHGLGLPRTVGKSQAKYSAWEKPRAGGTLESIVNQATYLPPPPSKTHSCTDELVPWFDKQRATAAASGHLVVDALVPCSNRATSVEDHSMPRVPDPSPTKGGLSRAVVGSSTGVGSCSGAKARKRIRVSRDGSRAQEGSSMNQSASVSESKHPTVDTSEMDLDFTSTSLGSPANTCDGKPSSSHTKATSVDDHDSVCHSRPQREEEKKKGKTGRSSISTKRSRAAAIHNQSERKRRDRINQKMKTLQKLVPNSSKTDKASMLDEVIEYLKQLQAQVQIISKMNTMSSMMMPMTMQQLQMAMMAQMSMGMGMGMGVMDMNSISRPAPPTAIPPMLHPAATFLPVNASWDGSGDRLTSPAGTIMPDPFSTFLACQSQPMTLDAYSRMASMFQQLHQPTQPNYKS